MAYTELRHECIAIYRMERQEISGFFRTFAPVMEGKHYYITSNCALGKYYVVKFMSWEQIGSLAIKKGIVITQFAIMETTHTLIKEDSSFNPLITSGMHDAIISLAQNIIMDFERLLHYVEFSSEETPYYLVKSDNCTYLIDSTLGEYDVRGEVVSGQKGFEIIRRNIPTIRRVISENVDKELSIKGSRQYLEQGDFNRLTSTLLQGIRGIYDIAINFPEP